LSNQDDTQDIINYYSKNGEDHRHLRQQLEFAIMKRTLKAYFSDVPLRFLELGAGTGWFTEILAEMGHEVVALEPTESLLRLNQKRLKEKKLGDRVEWVQADARDLSEAVPIQHENRKFDVILNMGPFYHLEKKADREKVFKDSLSILKPQGLHCGVFLSRVGYTSYVLNRQPESILQDPDGFRDIMTQGFFSAHPRDGTFRGHFTDLLELSELHQACEAQIQKIHILDPCIGGDDEIFNRLPDEQKAIWTEVLFALSADSGFWSSGRTWLAISQAIEKTK
jgi:S-adenosylmethionine-dependent methyltransferase